MKAIRIHKFGPTAEVLQYEEVPIPEPGPNELLIKVEAASLNRADLGLRKGTYRIAPEELPVIPGREFAGTVAKLGAGVQEFKVGQRVVAYTGTGGYAEYALAKVSETLPVPDGVDSASAAAMPTVFLTAWFGLLTDGKLKAGDWVLVQAGSSGVGIAAIQIAKHLGAKVITTSSGDDKCKRLRQLGANEAIDYTKQGFVAEIMRITGPAEGRDQAGHYQERLNPDVSEGVNVLHGLGIVLAARRPPFPKHRGVDVASRLRAFTDILLHHLAVAEDRRQDVVEVVRNAASERTDRFQLLCLAQLLLEPLALGLGVLADRDVLDRTRHPVRTAIDVA